MSTYRRGRVLDDTARARLETAQRAFSAYRHGYWPGSATGGELDQLVVDLDGYDTDIFIAIEAMIAGMPVLRLPVRDEDLRSRIAHCCHDPDREIRREAARLMDFLDHLEDLLGVAESLIVVTP